MNKTEFIEWVYEWVKNETEGLDYPSKVAITDEVNDLIRRAIEDHEAKQWNAYPENKPEKSGTYWITLKNGSVITEYFNGSTFGYYNKTTIAWMKIAKHPNPYRP